MCLTPLWQSIRVSISFLIQINPLQLSQSMFSRDPKELAKLAHEARQRNLSPQRRSDIATKASYSRWYKARGEQLDRIDSYLRGLALIAAKALAEGNDDKYLRAVAGMGQYERMKLMVEGNKASNAKPAEMTELDETVKESVRAFRKGRDEEVIDVTPAEGEKK